MHEAVVVVGRDDRAYALARNLSLPRYDALDDAAGKYHLAVLWLEDRLALQLLGKGAPGPVRLDWLNPAVARRIRGGLKQPLSRAVGLHRQPQINVLDATAGFGRDGFVLAALGATVTLCERSPLLMHLLQEARTHALARPAIAPWLSGRVRLYAGDARELCKDGAARPDVVYLDPMYPLCGKQSLAKKEMRILRALVGDDTDSAALFEAALVHARKRVVVKRPAKAPPLAHRVPELRYKGKRVRYDVYLLT